MLDACCLLVQDLSLYQEGYQSKCVVCACERVMACLGKSDRCNMSACQRDALPGSSCGQKVRSLSALV